MAGYRPPGSGARSMAGFAAFVVLGALGFVALYRATNAQEGEPVPQLLGIPLESAWPGAVLVALAVAIAAWALRAWHLAGVRAPRTHVPGVWFAQPPPGAKSFGDPPALPSHRAELAAQGVEAYTLPNGEWAVRRTGR